MTSIVLMFFMFYCLFNIEIPVVSYLGKRTMGIYLIHMPIVVNIIAVLFSRLNMPSLLLVLCGVIACIIVSNQTSWFLLKYQAGKIILGEGY